jgi:cytochrome d ubiquinol oxidase subunit II
MEATWFLIVAGMLTAWAVLDGFDFGAGAVHFIVGEAEEDRRTVLAAIGPVWDGNEVWLVAAGGVFVFAFPRAYAAALSGMYLPLFVVLWLLALRGIAIEFRAVLAAPLWRQAWDGVFAFTSTVMAFVMGVTFGNVVRGVPIDETGWFHLDLFAFGSRRVGALDAYTGLVGLLAVAVLSAHGATYLAWKTGGVVCARSRSVARRAWWVAWVLAAGVTVATAAVRPAMFVAFVHRPWTWPLPALAIASAFVVGRALGGDVVRASRERRAFLASCTFIASLVLATAAVLYPVLLPSTLDARFDLDVYAAASGDSTLALGLWWWIPALGLAVAYLANAFRSMRGKIVGTDHAEHP